MSGRKNDDFVDYDLFDDEIYSSKKRADKATGKRPVPKSSRTKARERRIRQLKNRSLIIIVGVVLLVLVIILFTIMIKGCGNKDNKVINVSTETIAKQQAKIATPSEAGSQTKQSTDSEKAASAFKTPNIVDDNSDAAVYGEVCVWNATGFLKFTPDQDSAASYAAAVNGFADKASSVKLYNMVVPSSAELCLPERLRGGEFNTSSQADFITAVNSSLSSQVTSINAYDALVDHNSEYIYYKTDDNWTDLGAYYAYDAFAKSAGLTPLSINDCEDKTIEGFFGGYSLYTADIGDDTVHYRYLPYEATMDVTDQSGNTYTNPSPYYEAATSGSYTYGVFLVGDNPLSVIHSGAASAQSDKKIAVIKEDYGDALAPYLSYNYGEVHVIDYRYFDMTGMSFSDYCSQNGITDVLIINDVASAGAQSQIDALNSL